MVLISQMGKSKAHESPSECQNQHRVPFQITAVYKFLPLKAVTIEDSNHKMAIPYLLDKYMCFPAKHDNF